MREGDVRRTGGAFSALSPDVQPLRIQIRPGAPSRVELSGGVPRNGVCIGCPNIPCMKYEEAENQLSVLPEFPADPDWEVCPTHAISREGDAGPPRIDSSRCIWCGVCVSRCPVGAIWLESTAGAVVETGESEGIEITTSTALNLDTQRRFRAAERVGTMLDESDPFLSRLESRLDSFLSLDSSLPVRLGRNMLRASGLAAVSRRTGDNNLRMDILFESGPESPGVAEVEFSEQVLLESPRAILDDAAVLVSRHHWAVGTLSLLVLPLRLPNRRSEYWSVIQDINRVLELRIQTLPVLSLMLHIWDGRVPGVHSGSFYADQGTPSLRRALFEVPLGRTLKFSGMVGAMVEPPK